jgi:predicted RNA binding protein YcfA (HicA-like mRNA interferase family)
MKPVSGKRMCKALRHAGWFLSRISGSHHIFDREGALRTISVPGTWQQDLKAKMQRGIMREAGLTDADL